MIKKLIVCALLTSSSITFSMLFLPKKPQSFFQQQALCYTKKQYNSPFLLQTDTNPKKLYTNKLYFVPNSSNNKMIVRRFSFPAILTKKTCVEKICTNKPFCNKNNQCYVEMLQVSRKIEELCQSNLPGEEKIFRANKFIDDIFEKKYDIFLTNCLKEVKDINKKDEDGNTILLCASKDLEVNKNIIEELAKLGADFHIKNNDGMSSIDYLTEDCIEKYFHYIYFSSFFSVLLCNQDAVISSLSFNFLLTYCILKIVFYPVSEKKKIATFLNDCKIPHNIHAFSSEIKVLEKIIKKIKEKMIKLYR